MQEERAGFIQWMRGPRNCLYTVRTSKWIVVVAILNIRFCEDPHTGIWLTRKVIGAMSSSQKNRCRKQCSATSKCWLTANFHEQEDYIGMTFAIQLTICNCTHRADRNCEHHNHREKN